MVRQPKANHSTRIDNWKRILQQLFSGKSSVGRTRPPESVKTSRFVLGRRNSLSPRLDIMRTQSVSLPAPGAVGVLQLPLPLYNSHQSSHQSRVEDIGQQNFTSFTNIQTERRLKKPRANRKMHQSTDDDKSRRSWLIMSCCTFIFLLITLGTYLSIILTTGQQGQPVHAILIICCLILFISFVYTTARYFLVKKRHPNEAITRAAGLIDNRGFANPRQPIRVTVARDEEAAGIVSEAFTRPPPAYGVWRESVRADPNRLLWARNPAAELDTGRNPSNNAQTTQRPPSYISEDGVAYVIFPSRRSLAPATMDIPLQELPSYSRT